MYFYKRLFRKFTTSIAKLKSTPKQQTMEFNCAKPYIEFSGANINETTLAFSKLLRYRD